MRDRDSIYGHEVVRTIHNHCTEQVLTAPRSPWQNLYVERVIGSIRRECLDHVIVVNENHLRKILKECFRYYTQSRTHLALAKDCPEPREVAASKHVNSTQDAIYGRGSWIVGPEMIAHSGELGKVLDCLRVKK